MRAKESLSAKLNEAFTDEDIPNSSDILLHSSARKKVDKDYRRIVRIDITGGTFTQSNEIEREEQDVEFTIQCFVYPDTEAFENQLEADDAAVDASFDLAKSIYKYLAVNPQLILKDQTKPQVCDLIFPENEQNFDLGMANFEGKRVGACYLYGIINGS